MLLRPYFFMPFCTQVSKTCILGSVTPSLDRGDEEGQGETQGCEETSLLASVLECLRHHRIGKHRQQCAASEGLDEGDHRRRSSIKEGVTGQRRERARHGDRCP